MTGAGLRLAVADDEHIGNLLQLGVADLGVHALAAVVNLRAQPRGGRERAHHVADGAEADHQDALRERRRREGIRAGRDGHLARGSGRG